MKALIQVVAFVFLTTFMLNLGLRAHERVVPFVRRHWQLVTRALVLDLVIMPLFTWLVVQSMGLRGPVAVGLLLLSVTPGVPLAPQLARHAGGSDVLAVARVLLTAALSVFTAPPSIRLLLGYEGQIDVHPGALILRLLALQVVPLAAGIALQARARAPAEALAKITDVVIAVTLPLFVVLAIVPRMSVFGELGIMGLTAALITTAIGWLMGYLMGSPQPEMQRTLAATTSPPNVGLATTMLTAASAPPQLAPVVLALFLTKAIANLVFVKVLGRRAAAPRQRRSIA